jgi:ATP-dependent RNA helicase DBP3
LRESGQVVPESLLKFGTAVKKKEHAMYGAHFKPVEGVDPTKKVHMKFD